MGAGTPFFALAAYAAVLIAACGAAALARPRHPDLATLLFAIPAAASFPVFWWSPGAVAVVASMYGFQIALRALDARASLGMSSASEYVRYCLWLRTHPSEDRPKEPWRARAVRTARGLTLIGATLVLATMGRRVQLWRDYPPLEDLLVASELALGLMGLVDVITVVAGMLGWKQFLVDGFLPGFLWSPSLSVFWATAWNRPTAGVLRRGIFVPSSERERGRGRGRGRGRSGRARGVGLVFLASGVMHAAPIVLGGANRWVWAWLAAGTLAFFLIQAMGVLVDAAFRRRGGRPLLVLVFALSLPFYPAPLAIAFGLDDRPPESSTILVVARVASDRLRAP